MKFAQRLYWGEHAAERKAYILKNLKRKKFQLAAYLVVRAQSPALFELYPAYWLLTPGFDNGTLEIVGIGYGYRESLRLIQRMVQDMYEEGRL